MNLNRKQMYRFLLVSLFMVMLVKGFGQNQNKICDNYNGDNIRICYYQNESICDGDVFSVFLDIDASFCGQATSVTWSVSSPHMVEGNGLNAQITAGSTSTVLVTAHYSCAGHIGASVTANFGINAKPSLGAKIGTTGTICQGSTVELDVINAVNVGTSPTYDYYVDNTVVHSGSETTWFYPTTGLAAGTHSLYIEVHASGNTNCTNVATSSTVNFSLTSRTKPSIVIFGPGNYCSGPAAFTATSSYIPFPGITTTYEWYVNNISQGSTSSKTFSLAYDNQHSQNTVYCKVTYSGSLPVCFVQPDVSNSYILHYGTAVTPAITAITSENIFKNYHCTGESIVFTAVGQNLYGNPITYYWTVDGHFVGETPTPNSPSIPIAKNASSGIMGPGSDVGVSVLGLSGACFTSTNASLHRSNVPIRVTPIFTGTTATSVCSGNATNITLSSDADSTTYQWTQSSFNVAGASNSTGYVNATSIVQTLTSSDNGSVVYTITPRRNGCTGTSKTATVTVNPVPAVATVGSGGIYPICGSGNVTLMAQAGNYGTEVRWYDTVIGGTYLGNSNSIIRYATTNTNYYVSSYNTATQCEGGRSLAQVLIKDIYTVPVNNIITQQVQVEGIGTTIDLNTQSIGSVVQQVQYFDGLGRHYQDVLVKQSPAQTDVVTTSVYDVFGREPKQLLPVTVGSNGCPKNNIIDGNGNYTGTTAYNNDNTSPDKIQDDARPYSETTLEASPLSRPLENYGPGDAWKTNAKYVKHQYLVNKASEVLLFTYDATTSLVSTGTGHQPGYYDAGQLAAKTTTDEHGNDVVEYVDKLSHTVCKKVQYKNDAQGNKLYTSTYYLYDDFGNLVVVLPPEAIKKILTQL